MLPLEVKDMRRQKYIDMWFKHDNFVAGTIVVAKNV